MHRLRPRGDTLLLRSGAAAERTPLLRGGGQEELPHFQGQGKRPRVPGCDSEGTAERNYPTSEVRGSGREELPHVRGQGWQPRGATPCSRSSWRLRVPGCDRAGAVERSYPMSEARGRGQEELPTARGQGWRPRQATAHPRSSGCTGTGGPRGAIPHSRSGMAAVRRYPLPKVRSSSCTLLEQP